MTQSVSTQTPLQGIHVSLGATMTDFAGWSMPLRYGSEIVEHRAARTAAGLFEVDPELTAAPDAERHPRYPSLASAGKDGV